MATLDDLAERFAPAMRSLRLDGFRRVLRKDQTAARHAISAALIARQRRTLREVSQRSNGWSMTGDDWRVLRAGLERIYRNAKQRMRAAARSRDSEHLHDWRKQVKYLWHQLQMLQPAWPGMLGELADQAHKLADHLGDDHDLAVLQEKITAHPDVFEGNDRDALIAVLESRRKQLQDKAFRLGARIFAEKPRRFTNRIGGYWQAWRARAG
jgi:CHAD domain-containing protein